MEAELVGVSFSVKKDEGFYIPINHVEQTELNASEVIEWLKQLLEINQNKIIGQNLKYDIAVLRNHDIYVKDFFADTMLMSYAANSTSSRHNLDALAEHYLNTSTIKYEDVVGKGAKKYKNFSEVPIKEATNYAAEDADITLQLFEKLSEIIDVNSIKVLSK